MEAISVIGSSRPHSPVSSLLSRSASHTIMFLPFSPLGSTGRRLWQCVAFAARRATGTVYTYRAAYRRVTFADHDTVYSFQTRLAVMLRAMPSLRPETLSSPLPFQAGGASVFLTFPSHADCISVCLVSRSHLVDSLSVSPLLPFVSVSPVSLTC